MDDESYVCTFIQEPPLAMYDVGVGGKSEWKTFLSRYPSMKLFGCEPHAGQYQSLMADGFPGTLLNAAIGAMPGKVKLHAADEPMWSSLFKTSVAKEERCVHCLTLDDFDERAGKPDQILLWMDIEGSELVALESGLRLLKSGRVVWINVETRDQPPCDGWCDAVSVRNLLNDHGYVKAADYNKHPTHRDEIYVLPKSLPMTA